MAATREMAGKVETLRSALEAGDVDAVGPLLHEAWTQKRSLSDSVTNPEIDDIYERARAAGSTGGKLLGAGAGGFLLLAHPDHDRLAAALQGYPKPTFRGGHGRLRDHLSEIASHRVDHRAR